MQRALRYGWRIGSCNLLEPLYMLISITYSSKVGYKLALGELATIIYAMKRVLWENWQYLDRLESDIDLWA